MSKRFINQYCIHCLKYFEQLTEDHIFPKSWYPNSTPQNMEKWVAPACLECNNKLGKIENELYRKMAICINSEDIAASGVSDKVVKMINPLFAKDRRSKRRKEAYCQKILRELICTTNNKMPKGLMRNFGSNDTLGESRMISLSVPELLDPFIHKVVRGLEYKLKNRLINTDRKIKTIHPVTANIIDSELTTLNAFFEINGIEVNRGPGFIIRCAEDTYGSVLYHVIIWGRWETWIAVSGLKSGI
ncbi:MAG: HNH endonuclease [Patescibacteria group bacterium]|nr:HNH endonuclease [Patescibacteria group bacterium]